jgi:hypothetical protein
MYEESNERIFVGQCKECGCDIYADMDRYEFTEDVIVCTECINEFVNYYLVYGDE